MPAPTLRLVKGAPLTNAEVDANFNDLYNEKLDKAGGTMTGLLTLSGDPVSGLQASTKQYVDNSYLPKAGGTLTGPLTLAGDPTTALHAATKAYVDSKIGSYLPTTGGALTGTLTLAGDPTSGLQAATKSYVDAQRDTRLALSGGTLTGALTLAGDPASSLQAATKAYVDTKAGNYLPLTGGTLTGLLALAGAPTSALHAATKAYVDGTVTSLTGTANQISVSASTGAVTLSLPQNIHTGTTFQVWSLGVGTPATGFGGEIRATNEITAYYSSDLTLKENIRSIDSPLAKLAKIRGVFFDWKDELIQKRGGEDGFFVRKADVGIIAQDVKEVLPEVVGTRNDGTLGVKYEKIIPLLIESIKDLQRQVARLQGQILPIG